MAAHLPLPIRVDGSGNNIVDFATPVQHCVKYARRFEIIANIIKIIGPIGSIFILFLLGFWAPKDGESAMNMVILYTNMTLALLISLSSALNELFTFQRRAKKYQAARRILTNMDSIYDVARDNNKNNKSYLDKLQLWARENVAEIEQLLDDENVYDLEKSFQQKQLPN